MSNSTDELLHQAAKNYSGRKNVVVDMGLICGEADHWLLQERAFKSGSVWERERILGLLRSKDGESEIADWLEERLK